MILQGIGASGGLGIGQAVCIRGPEGARPEEVFAGAEREQQRLSEAAARFRETTARMAEEISARLGTKEAEILTGQITMLEDPCLLEEVYRCIDGGQPAAAAVDQVCTAFADMFAALDDPMMGQRAADVRDMRDRLCDILLGVEQPDVSHLPAGTILVIRDLPPSLAAGLDREHVEAIVTERGGITSHAAILARAMELPAVLSVPAALEQITDGDLLVVDGGKGTVVLKPDQEALAEAHRAQQAHREEKARLERYRTLPTRDGDGVSRGVWANIGTPAEGASAAGWSAEGIGLFRTEFLFMDRSALPDEEEQTEAYRAVSLAMAGKEVIIRTLDVGGDKDIPYLGLEREENPFLGFRAIRYCLAHEAQFKTQLRALLRAGAEEKNLAVMLPMVTCLEEVEAARKLLETCKQELEAEGKVYDKDIRLGIMIETPAAVLIARRLARVCDFFSIGTNDLTQYVMASDRGNSAVCNLYSHFYPAVLEAIRTAVTAAKEGGIPVGMCGEAAADPLLIPLLLRWGLDEFSVSPTSVLRTRWAISCWTGEETERLEREVMAADTAEEIRRLLEQAWKEKQ